jgi:hypothetical protein
LNGNKQKGWYTMARTQKDWLTDDQVEIEIDRLLHSEDVQLAKKETRIKLRRRQYMYCLRSMEKRGKQLAAEGITLDNIEERLFGEDAEGVDE